MAANTARRRAQRQRRRHLATLAFLGALVGSVRAGNSTVAWQYTPGSATQTSVDQCGDSSALILSAPNSPMAGVVNASTSFMGSYIEVYGLRYKDGAAALIVVDDDYNSAVHVDESLAAANGHPSDECVLLARFANLTSHIEHTLQVVLQGDPVAPITLTIANVTSSVTAPSGDSGTSSSPKSSSGPSLIAIVAPVAAVILLFFGGLILWLLRRRRIRNARKAPSAAFRAQHPDLSIPRTQTDDDIREAGLDNVTSPVGLRVQHSHHPMAGGSTSSSGTTLVGLSYGDEKKKLAEILAVRDAEELELQQREQVDSGRVPWDTRDHV